MNMSYQSLPSLNDDPTLRAYRAAVRDWHGYMRFLGFVSIQDNEDVPIDNLFVPPELAESAISPDAEPSSWAKRTAFLDCLEPGLPLVVLGDPGSGKSTLVNWLTWRLASGLTRTIGRGLDGCLPVPMILREMSLGELNTFDDLLNAFLARPVAAAFKGDASLIREFAAAGRVLFLLDGIDELSTAASKRLRKVLSNLPSGFSSCFWLLTSRIVGYDDFLKSNVSMSRTEIEAMAAGDSSASRAGRPAGMWARVTSATLPGWLAPFLSGNYKVPAHKTLYVAPFDDRRIEAFANAWYQLRDNAKTRAEATAKEFLAAIQRDVGITRLARTPNLLTLMALVFRVKAQLPDGRGMLYDDISQAYLESIDRARGGVSTFRSSEAGSEGGEPPWREKKRWLARVGFEMQLRRASKSEGVNAYEETTRELLFSTEEVCGWLTTAMDVSGYGGGRDEAGAFLDWAARRSGLLVPRGEGLHAFMHLSFQEYFAAAFIIEEFKSPDWSSASESDNTLRANGLHPEITRENLAAWAGETVWEEVLILAFEQLAHEPRWAERLLKVALPAELTDDSEDLAARLLLNPHSGLNQKTRSALRDAVHRRIAEDQQSFSYYDGLPFSPSLSRVWRDPVERNLWVNAFASLEPTQLNVRNCEIDSLDFLAYFPTLTELSLPFPASRNLDAIAGLNDLVRFRLFGAENPNFAPLALMEKLTSLDLTSCQMNDLSGLNAVKNLSGLSLIYCTIKTMDMSLLNRAVPISLSIMGVRSNRIVNSQSLPIAFAKLFIYFDFGGGGYLRSVSSSQCAAILNWTVAEALTIWGHDRTIASELRAALAKQTRLKRLELKDSALPSLAFVRALPQLRELHIEQANIKNYDALDGLTELEVWVNENVKSKVKFRSGRGPKMHYVKVQ